jgi:outer membrane protein OmpA-like peptidoglycan-associated protein
MADKAPVVSSLADVAPATLFERVLGPQRQIRRLEADRLPFIPFGVLPLAGLVPVFLFGLTAFAHGAVQSVAAQSARAALDRIGADWAQVRASGQWIVLEGNPPSTTDAGEALDAVRKAQAPTMFGVTSPIARVTAGWSEGALEASAAPIAPAARAACDQSLAQLLSGASIAFETESAAIGAASSGLLDRIAEAAKACPGVLRIEGHTDDEGREAFNQRLSLERAQAVRRELVRRGISEARLAVEGFGSRNPIASNQDEQGRTRNRRIEIRVTPEQN